MNSAIDQAKELLESQLLPLRNERQELGERLSVVDRDIKKLETALGALHDTKPAKRPKTRKPSKPCAKKEEVMDICLAIVRDNAPILKSDLELLAVDKIVRDLGYSKSGLQLHLNRCLSSEAFAIDDQDLISLVASGSKELPEAVHETTSGSTGD